MCPTEKLEQNILRGYNVLILKHNSFQISASMNTITYLCLLRHHETNILYILIFPKFNSYYD